MVAEAIRPAAGEEAAIPPRVAAVTEGAIPRVAVVAEGAIPPRVAVVTEGATTVAPAGAEEGVTTGITTGRSTEDMDAAVATPSSTESVGYHQYWTSIGVPDSCVLYCSFHPGLNAAFFIWLFYSIADYCACMLNVPTTLPL